jgi:hypothetical protein
VLVFNDIENLLQLQISPSPQRNALEFFSTETAFDWPFESILGATLIVKVATTKEIKIEARALDFVFIFNVP